MTTADIIVVSLTAAAATFWFVLAIVKMRHRLDSSIDVTMGVVFAFVSLVFAAT